MEHGTIPSFDGTRIGYSLVMPESDADVPVIFITHGWGGSRSRTFDADATPDTIGRFLLDGYAVITWDARGFGESGGEANVDSQEFEVRDVQALIDRVAARDGIRLDAEGASDTLFPINEAVANYRQITANGTPARMIWFCGGHTITPAGTSCAAGADQGTTIAGEIDAWFATHLKDEPEAQGAPAVRHQLQDGSFRALDALTEPTAAATGVATLVSAVAPTSGQVTAGTPGGADSTRISFALDPGVQIVGIPRVRVVATSLTNAPESYAFFKLVDVDTTTGEATVIDDQTTALKIAWAGALVGARRVVEIDLAGVAWSVEPGHQVSLEISPTSNDHASSRFPSVTQLAVDASLPVIAT